MSTRSNIIIKHNNETVKTLYKHHDGYIAGVGIDLVRYLIPLKTYIPIEPKDLLSVLSNRYDTIHFSQDNIKMVVQQGDPFQNLEKKVEHLIYKYEYETKQESIYILERDIAEAVDLDDKATLNEVRKIYSKQIGKQH